MQNKFTFYGVMLATMAMAITLILLLRASWLL
jgi:hypothetical protein